MTGEEKQKAIDALKISAPVIAMTQEEFNDYIQTLNKIMDWLEQEPCEDCISRQVVLEEINRVGVKGFETYNDYSQLYDFVDTLPPTTPQKPCEDCISRQAVIDMTGLSEWFDSSDSYNEFVIALSDLPSVTPQPKIGHWIEHPEIETSTPEYLMFYECSECGDKQCFCKSDIHKKRFCGNCGCRMVEPQESEDKE